MRVITKLILLGGLLLPVLSFGNNSSGSNFNGDYHAGVIAIQTQHYTTALQYFLKSAKMGNPAAQYNVGYMYEIGLGTTQNYPLAMQYYQEAAENGNTDAMINLGVMYAQGKGIKQDVHTAITWYQKAYNHGETQSSLANIGLIYYFGLGTPKNNKLARQYLNRASANGDIKSNYYLGQIYFQGQGVESDYQKAYNYFYKAKLLGDPDANQGLATLYAKLTPQQIQQLQNGTFQMSEVGQKPAVASNESSLLLQQLPPGGS